MAKRICTLPECGKPHRARGLCTQHWKQQYGKRPTVTVPCTVCGAEVTKRAGDNRRFVCSDLCRRHLQFGDWPTSTIPPTHPAHPDYAAPEEPWYWTGRSCRVFYTYCAVCAKLFTTPYTVTTCSPTCTETKRKADKREAKHRRRAMAREAYVAPVRRREIFERDGWRCQLCHRMVRRDKEVPHPLAPTLDHIVPLSQGGTHEPANVQCAHFMCNSIKGDRGGGEQLLLIG